MDRLEIRPASREEFASAIEWAASEGWNPGLDDLAPFHGADPDGCIMGFIDGTPVSSISVIRYGKDFGFLGFYIVHPDHRGTGLGFATWQAGLHHLHGRTIGLDGVVDQQDNYSKSGFVLAGRNIRYGGLPETVARKETACTIHPVCETDFNALLALDMACFGAGRATFLHGWLLPGESVARSSLVAKNGGQIKGFGTIRQCREGYKIGPLFCESPQIARQLALALIATVPQEEIVILDVPEDNEEAVALAQTLGLAPLFETARMYMGPPPKIALDRVFGVTTFELG